MPTSNMVQYRRTGGRGDGCNDEEAVLRPDREKAKDHRCCSLVRLPTRIDGHAHFTPSISRIDTQRLDFWHSPICTIPSTRSGFLRNTHKRSLPNDDNPHDT